MIRRGKTDGWLSAGPFEYHRWGVANGARFQNIGVKTIAGRGSSLTAVTERLVSENNPLLLIPRELILSKEAVQGLARSDAQLREVLDAVGDFSQVGPFETLCVGAKQCSRSD